MPLAELTAALTVDFETLSRSSALAPVDVAVIDSGIDASHPDLRDRVIEQYAVDLAGAGVMAVTPLASGTNNDSFGHGTAVASIIAGIAPNARLFDIRVLDARNKGNPTASVEAFRYCLSRRFRLINMSLSIPASQKEAVLRQCESAYGRGQLVVAARRNVPVTDEGYPAEFSSVLAVDNGDLPSCFAVGFNPAGLIEFAARGTEVVAAAPGGGYTVKTGTSFATPAVSGLCALLLGRWPRLRQFELKTILKAHAERQT